MTDPKPAPREFLLYPDAKRVQALPRDELTPFILERLGEQAERKVPDFERCWGLGQLAGKLQVDEIEQPLEGWLGERDTATALDSAALFLQAYWKKRDRVRPSLVQRLLQRLSAHGDAAGARDSSVLALAAAYPKVESAQRDEIRVAFLRVRSANDAFQPAVDQALKLVLRDEPAATTSGGPDFRGYQCEDGPVRYFAVERSATATEVIRVATPALSERLLAIDYELRDPSLGESVARSLIFEIVLVSLLRDSYRGRVDRIRYNNRQSKSSVVTPYEKPS